ncbi:30S ribosomal protein S17 [Puccinia sorghi]|uniref:30S ribosomal protein S17 n=1 Tax=Puccinia sorghi TaxID=27349 RepID=A0A0L6V6G7_9BASI|nr:30S ribosomal protein S17 [Puccinia sorghi]
MSLLATKAIVKPVVGVVIQSGVQSKTVKVLRTTQVLHRVVPKAIKKNIVYSVHDEKNSAKRGDKVEIVPTGRRISTNKTYALSRILN